MTTNNAPSKYLECPRCGAVTFTARGVQLHDSEHRRQDIAEKVNAAAAAATEAIQDFNTKVAALDRLATELKALKDTPPAGFTLEAGEWPSTDQPTEPEPDDEDEPLPAALLTEQAAYPALAPVYSTATNPAEVDDLEARIAAQTGGIA